VKTAVVLTALPVEYKAVRDHLSDLREERHDQGTIYEVGSFPPGQSVWSVAIAEIGMGNSSAAMEAERAISYFRPDVALMVGVAGGIKDVAIGDVVAANIIYGYESGKSRRSFDPRPNIGVCSYRLLQQAMAEARRSNWTKRVLDAAGQNHPQALNHATVPRSFVKPIAAGEKVVASTRSDIYRFLRKQYGDALAIEMEGRGFLASAHANSSVEGLVIRGISDLINKKAMADAQGGQHLASINASAFAFELLANLALEEDIRYRVEFEGTIESSNERIIDELLKEVRKLTKDSTLKLIRVKYGSIILDGMRRLVSRNEL
jgi:nucleoside phosphorylase